MFFHAWSCERHLLLGMLLLAWIWMRECLLRKGGNLPIAIYLYLGNGTDVTAYLREGKWLSKRNTLFYYAFFPTGHILKWLPGGGAEFKQFRCLTAAAKKTGRRDLISFLQKADLANRGRYPATEAGAEGGFSSESSKQILVHKRLRTHLFGSVKKHYPTAPAVSKSLREPIVSFPVSYRKKRDTHFKKANSGVPNLPSLCSINNKLIRDPEVGTETESEEAPMWTWITEIKTRP